MTTLLSHSGDLYEIEHVGWSILHVICYRGGRDTNGQLIPWERLSGSVQEEINKKLRRLNRAKSISQAFDPSI